jgi:PKD repeat protein
VAWSFEGGLPVSSNASNVDVTFNIPGTYYAVLTSTTSLGTDTMTQTITVVEAPSLSANIGTASATADNGFIFINMSGGLPPFTTTWMNMPGLNDLTVNFLASGTYEVTITDAAGCSIDTVFIVQRAEGIEEYSQSTFQAFPNPTKEIITLRFNANQKPENISLFDLSGRKLQQFQVEQASKNEVVFSCADLASGTYIIQVQFRNSTVAYKRIVRQ